MKRGPHMRHIYGLVVLLLSVLLIGCGNKNSSGEGNIDGVSKYNFTISAGRAVLSVVFDNLPIDAGARIPLQRPAGAFIEIGPDFNSGGTLFVISTPLASVMQGNGDLMQVGLPDGRAIPGVRGGVLGAIAVNLPLFGVSYLYMGVDVFGLFLPIKLPNVPVMITTRMRDERGNLIGVIVGIPKGSKGEISGVLFLFPVEGTGAARTIKKIL